jgi:hypothetical protein
MRSSTTFKRWHGRTSSYTDSSGAMAKTLSAQPMISFLAQHLQPLKSSGRRRDYKGQYFYTVRRFASLRRPSRPALLSIGAQTPDSGRDNHEARPDQHDAGYRRIPSATFLMTNRLASLRHPTGKLCTPAQARAERRGVSWAAVCHELTAADGHG